MLKTRKILILMLIIVLILSFWISGVIGMNKHISDNVLRLHILAESDNIAHQELKLKVRDRILAEFSPSLAETKNREESIALAKKLLPQIELAANDEIIKQGYAYTATATIEETSFPTKSYGNITLPAGKYQALKIVIGSGKGQNWWCVMYPPLCLIDGATEPARETLKKSLTPEEYELITQSEDSIKIRIKFKIAEIFR